MLTNFMVLLKIQMMQEHQSAKEPQCLLCKKYEFSHIQISRKALNTI